MEGLRGGVPRISWVAEVADGKDGVPVVTRQETIAEHRETPESLFL